MNKYTVKPRRPLTSNFAERTLKDSIAAKKYSRQRKFAMQLQKILKQPAGALAALGIVLFSAAGTYAAINWFNGHVGVKTDNSIMSIDISSCKNAWLPGFPDNQDMHNVQFKILGEPHISQADLTHDLLAQCEYDAVTDFYHGKQETKNIDLHGSKILAVDNNAVTLSYLLGGKTMSKQFQLSPDATFYNQGVAAKMSDLKVGQTVIFATAGQTSYLEGTDPLQNITKVLSVFITQYDTMSAPVGGKGSSSYDAKNIMPLDMYNRLYKK